MLLRVRLKPDATSRRSADGVFQRLAGTEADDATLGNLDRGAGLRIAGGARLALGGLERTEADEGDRIAALEGSGDAVDERVNGGRGAGLGRARVFRDFRDQ